MKRLTRRFIACAIACLPALSLFAALAAPPKPPTLGATVQGPTITVPDPKLPGRLQLMVHAREIRGTSEGGGFGGTMSSVYAQLYQQGQPSAILTAPLAVASSRQKAVVVTATGGVVVKSLTQPGTRLTADKMVWYAGQNKIIATGHVVYKDGKTGAVLTGPSMTADTRMQTVQMGPGRAAANV